MTEENVREKIFARSHGLFFNIQHAKLEDKDEKDKIRKRPYWERE